MEISAHPHRERRRVSHRIVAKPPMEPAPSTTENHFGSLIKYGNFGVARAIYDF